MCGKVLNKEGLWMRLGLENELGEGTVSSTIHCVILYF